MSVLHTALTHFLCEDCESVSTDVIHLNLVAEYDFKGDALVSQMYCELSEHKGRKVSPASSPSHGVRHREPLVEWA